MLEPFVGAKNRKSTRENNETNKHYVIMHDSSADTFLGYDGKFVHMSWNFEIMFFFVNIPLIDEHLIFIFSIGNNTEGKHYNSILCSQNLVDIKDKRLFVWN